MKRAPVVSESTPPCPSSRKNRKHLQNVRQPSANQLRHALPVEKIGKFNYSARTIFTTTTINLKNIEVRMTKNRATAREISDGAKFAIQRRIPGGIQFILQNVRQPSANQLRHATPVEKIGNICETRASRQPINSAMPLQ